MFFISPSRIFSCIFYARIKWASTEQCSIYIRHMFSWMQVHFRSHSECLSWDVFEVYFFNFYFLNFILFLNFTILYWFCQISKWIRHRYTCVPHPEPSSLLPPHTIHLGRPSTPAPSIQYRASSLDWRLVSYMIVYMFQCHSPSHTF